MKDNSINEEIELQRPLDKGLLKALQQQPMDPLVHNFSFRTMQRIKKEERQRAHRTKVTEIVLMAFVSFLGIAFIVVMAGNSLKEIGKSLSNLQLFESLSAHPLVTVTLICCLIFLGGMNLFLENVFRKR